jgi:putative transposase
LKCLVKDNTISFLFNFKRRQNKFLLQRLLAQASACAVSKKMFVHSLMSRKYKFHDNDKLYFISFSTVHWIDVFVRQEYMEIIIDSWKFCQEKKGLEIYGWCIMPSHVHMIIGSIKNKLEDIVRDMKSFTSTALRKSIKENIQESRKEWIIWMMERAGKKNGNNNDWQFWQRHNKPLEIKDQDMFDKTLGYIHLNPVMVGFVTKSEDWKYSSARDFAGLKGFIELNFT